MINFLGIVFDFICDIFEASWVIIKITFCIGIVVAICGGLVVGCQQTKWSKEANKRNEARQLAEATPHVIHIVDGCKVYEFRAGGHLHYFTRCPRETTTDTTIEERHGKQTQYRTETQVIQNSIVH